MEDEYISEEEVKKNIEKFSLEELIDFKNC